MNESGTAAPSLWRQSVALPLTLAVAVAVSLVGVVLFDRLPLLVAGGITLAAGLAMFRWPDVTTLVVIGLLYSNLPVVAVRFHGAPGLLPAAVLALLSWPVLYHVAVRKERLYVSSAFLFVVAFLVVQILGALLARHPQLAFEKLVEFVLEGVLLFLLITNVVRTRRLAVACFWTLACCAILMGGVPAWQQATGTFDSEYGGLAQADSKFAIAADSTADVEGQTRAAGTIGEQNRYAQFMVILIPISVALVSMKWPRGQRVVALLAVAAALLGSALAFSRGALVGMVLALAIATWLKVISRQQLKFVLIGAALVLLLLPQYWTRLASLKSVAQVAMQREGLGQADGATRGRLTEMAAALLVFRDHLLIGAGPGMFEHFSQEYGQAISLRPLAAGRQAHCMALDIAAEHGLLGSLAMTGLLVVVFRGLLQARRAARERNDNQGGHLANGILLALILYLTTGLFLHLSFIRYFWLLLALGDAIGRIVVQGDRGGVYLPGRWPTTHASVTPFVRENVLGRRWDSGLRPVAVERSE